MVRGEFARRRGQCGGRRLRCSVDGGGGNYIRYKYCICRRARRRTHLAGADAPTALGASLRHLRCDFVRSSVQCGAVDVKRRLRAVMVSGGGERRRVRREDGRRGRRGAR